MKEAEAYIEQLWQDDEDLRRAKEGTKEAGMPEIEIAAPYGRLLTLLVRMSGAKAILEIGALGGYSGICLARGLADGGTLTSLELKEAYAEVARRHLTQAGYGERVTYQLGDARESLAALEREGKRYDFFFIDADKEGYLYYLDMAIRLARPGAVIVADNTFLRGRVLNPAKEGPAVQAVRAFNERLATDERLDSTMLPSYDGLAIARVK